MNGTTNGSEKITDSLANGIQELNFDPDGPIFFNDWYTRYEDEAAKVRLLLRKLSISMYEKYVDSIRPMHPRDFEFDKLVSKLKKLLG